MGQVPVSGTAVTVAAEATDNVGVVGVQFYLDGVPLGSEERIFPYSFLWDTTQVPDGIHQLTARARDAAGNSATSPAVAVLVTNADVDPPNVSLTTPSGGQVLAGTVVIAADASDNAAVAGVRFFVDGLGVGSEDLSAPFRRTWDTLTVADGIHVLTAVARDSSGNLSTSAAVSVQVDNQLAVPNPPPPDPDPGDPEPPPEDPPPPDPVPPPEEDAPPPATYVPPGDVRVRLTLEREPSNLTRIRASFDLNGVEGLDLYLDGNLDASSSGASLDYTWDAQNLMGYHEVRVIRASSSGGVVAGASILHSPSTTADGTATLELSPVPFIGATVVRLTYSLPGVQRSELYMDGILRHTESGVGPIDYGWDTRDLTGVHDVLAVIYNDSGVLASLSVRYRPN